MQLLLFVIGFLMFLGLVLIHEWGHYWAAVHGGVRVREFGLGFPPRAWAKKAKSGMIISLNWLPLGGFVRLKGEHDMDKRSGSFGAAPLLTKVKIMLAGVAANFAAGLVLLTILAAAGMPVLIDNQFTIASDTKIIRQEVRAGDILSSSAATRTTNLQTGQIDPLRTQDIISSISSDGTTQKINTTQQLRSFTQSHQNQAVQISIVRDGRPHELKGQIGDYLGIVPAQIQLQRSTWSAPVVALGLTKQVIVLTAQGIWHALEGLGSAVAGLVTVNHQARENGQAQASDQAGGPVAIVAILWNSGDLGINFIIGIIAVLSLTLAIINILPIPALDGGRLFVTLLFRALRKRLTPEMEARIHGTGMLVLLALFVLITIVDVKRFY